MNLPENDENAEAAMEIITVRTERNSDVIDSSGNLSPGYANVTNHAWMPINREKKTKIKINKMKKKVEQRNLSLSVATESFFSTPYRGHPGGKL